MEAKRSYTDFDEAVRSYEKIWCGSYDPGIARHVDMAQTTVKETMAALLKKDPQATVIRFEDQNITRAFADGQACRLANALDECGVKKGDRVSIVVSNRPETIYAFTACYKAGYVAAGFNHRCTPEEIAKTIAYCESTALIIERAQVEKVFDAYRQGRFPRMRCLVVLDGIEGLDTDGSIYEYGELVAAAPCSEPSVDLAPEDNALFLLTGGTTGVSKGCCQTHGALTLELRLMYYWIRGALCTPDPSVLVCMPMTHIMGINYGINWQLVNGGQTIILNRYDAASIVAGFDAYAPTMWATLPTLMNGVNHYAGLADSKFKNLELIVFGGSFIAADTIRSLDRKTKACIVESYGMSESFGFVSCNPVGSRGKVGSTGLPISNTDILIVDLETGTTALPPGSRGEIIFRGPQTIQEYWNCPAETKHAFRNGWLYSGDIGYMDDDGFFYLVDRKKDMIIVSGFNVFPKEVDEILMTNPKVYDACTIGVVDEHSGERPKSFVVLKEGAFADAEEIRRYCKKYLVAYKVPKLVEFVQSIPKTRATKPDRERLKALDRVKSRETQGKEDRKLVLDSQ